MKVILMGAGTEETVLPEEGLTPRERQVARQLKDGQTNKEIGRALGIEEQTVKSHMHNILQKLKVKRRGQAIARLIRDKNAQK
jgi:two-component system, NarL family, nitrate/nitrite response regulator NarL